MRRVAPALLLLSAGAWLPVAGGALDGADRAPAQDRPTLRLDVSTTLRKQMEETPEELSWSDLPGQILVEYVSGEGLPLERIPVELVAVGVRGGEVVGRTSTTPSVATAGQPSPVSDYVGGAWPPAREWFPPAAWRPDGISSTDGPVPTDVGTAISRLALPAEGGAVLIFASPAAEELSERCSTLPVVITMSSTGRAAGSDTAAADTTGG